LGTRRLDTDNCGTKTYGYQSLPFGDGLQTVTYNQPCTGANTPDTERHFTGKERDSESNLDYFGARYYGSSLGRFMTPDWAATAIAVPFADFGDPRSLNLYGYVRSNPVSAADPDGHCADGDESCGPRYSTNEVTAIVYNEVGSLRESADSKPSLSNLYQDLAHAVYNGEQLKRQPDNAGTELSKGATETSTYKNIAAEVKCACEDAKKGIDPTKGADHFNNRTKDDSSDRKYYDAKGKLTGTAPLSQRDGPYAEGKGKSEHKKWETFTRTKDEKPVKKE